MAEARAMRRCLARAFPVGLSSFEDVQEQEAVAKAYQTNTEDAPNPLATKIANTKSMEELEALKPEITKSKSNDMVKAYATRQAILKNDVKIHESADDYIEKTGNELKTELESIEDHEAGIRDDAEREEKDKIQELAEEIKEEE